MLHWLYFFNRVSLLFAILQKPKNNLYDTVFGYINRLRAIAIVLQLTCITNYTVNIRVEF